MPITNPFTSKLAIKAASPLDPKQSDPSNTDTMELDPATQKLKEPAPYEQAPSMRDVLKQPKPWGESGYQTKTVETSLARLLTPSEGHLTGAAGSALKGDMASSDLDVAGKQNPQLGAKKKAKKEDVAAVAGIVVFLLHARTIAHLLHLQTRSFAKHMALDELYNALPGLVDSFVEAYQGLYGVIESYPVTTQPPFVSGEPVAFVEALKDWFSGARSSAPDDSELQNLLDEIASQLDSSLYKLKNLE